MTSEQIDYYFPPLTPDMDRNRVFVAYNRARIHCEQLLTGDERHRQQAERIGQLQKDVESYRGKWWDASGKIRLLQERAAQADVQLALAARTIEGLTRKARKPSRRKSAHPAGPPMRIDAEEIRPRPVFIRGPECD